MGFDSFSQGQMGILAAVILVVVLMIGVSIINNDPWSGPPRFP